MWVLQRTNKGFYSLQASHSITVFFRNTISFIWKIQTINQIIRQFASQLFTYLLVTCFYLVFQKLFNLSEREIRHLNLTDNFSIWEEN